MANDEFWERRIAQLPPHFIYQGERRVSESGKSELLVKCAFCGSLRWLTPYKTMHQKSCGCLHRSSQTRRKNAKPKKPKPTIEELLEVEINSSYKYTTRKDKPYKPTLRKSELDEVFRNMFNASRGIKNE